MKDFFNRVLICLDY